MVELSMHVFSFDKNFVPWRVVEHLNMAMETMLGTVQLVSPLL